MTLSLGDVSAWSLKGTYEKSRDAVKGAAGYVKDKTTQGVDATKEYVSNTKTKGEIVLSYKKVEQLLDDLYTWTYQYKPADDPNEHFAYYELDNKTFTHYETEQSGGKSPYYREEESVFDLRKKCKLQTVFFKCLEHEDLEGLRRTLFKIQQNIGETVTEYDKTLETLCKKYFDSESDSANDINDNARYTHFDLDDCKRNISEFTKWNDEEADYRDYEKAYRSIQYAKEKLFPQLEDFYERLEEIINGVPPTRMEETTQDMSNIGYAPTLYDDPVTGKEPLVRFSNVEQDLFPSWRGSGQVQLKMEQMLHRMSPAERQKLTELEEQLKQRQKEYFQAKEELEIRQQEVKTKNADMQEARNAIIRLEDLYSACESESSDDMNCSNLDTRAEDAVRKLKASEDDTWRSEAKQTQAEEAYRKADALLNDAQEKYDSFLTHWHELNVLPYGVIGKNCDGHFLLDYMPVFTKIILYLVSPIVFLMFVFAGVKFLYGGDDEEALSGAKKWFSYAVIGFLLILLSYSIMKATYYVFATSEDEYSNMKYECHRLLEVEEEKLQLDETSQYDSDAANTQSQKNAESSGDAGSRSDVAGATHSESTSAPTNDEEQTTDNSEEAGASDDTTGGSSDTAKTVAGAAAGGAGAVAAADAMMGNDEEGNDEDGSETEKTTTETNSDDIEKDTEDETEGSDEASNLDRVYTDVTPEEFESLLQKSGSQKIIFKMGLPTCGPCVRYDKEIPKYLQDPRSKNVIFVTADISTQGKGRALYGRYKDPNKNSVPQIALFEGGKKTKHQTGKPADIFDAFGL